MTQKWFEFRSEAALTSATWIPLRQSTKERDAPAVPDVVEICQYVGRSTIAVAEADRADAEALDWSDLNLSGDGPEINGGRYVPSDTVMSRGDAKAVGVKLVLDQQDDSTERVWHLHQDIVLALKLVREDDAWLRPEEGWAVVAKLSRDAEGAPTKLEMRAEFLADYLAARGMALYVSSYLERRAEVSGPPCHAALPKSLNEISGRDRREVRVYPDITAEDERQTALGALWRTEWFRPRGLSVRVRGDSPADEPHFTVNAAGERQPPAKLVHGLDYLFFKPDLANALSAHRRPSLHWYSRDTGSLGATATAVHFGLNELGLITILAKDIGNLDHWEKRLWSAYNVTPEGGVSKELWAAQMDLRPAATEAPETGLEQAIADFDNALLKRLGNPVLRPATEHAQLVRRTHRFRGVEHDGLPALAKDLTRLVIERIDVGVIRPHLTLTKDEKIGSLKAIERLLQLHVEDKEARAVMAPLFGVYDLRLADAHLGGQGRSQSALERTGVDASQPQVAQARQLLYGFVSALHTLARHFAGTPSRAA